MVAIPTLPMPLKHISNLFNLLLVVVSFANNYDSEIALAPWGPNSFPPRYIHSIYFVICDKIVNISLRVPAKLDVVKFVKPPKIEGSHLSPL